MDVQQWVDEIRSRLQSCINKAEELNQENGEQPAPNSTAAREWALIQEGGMVPPESYRIADVLLVASSDYLSALTRLYVEPLPSFSCMVLTRSIMENTARVWWLLDNNIDGRERAARGVNEDLRSLYESQELDALLEMSSDPSWIREELIAWAIEQGYEVKQDRRGREFLQGVDYQSITGLVEGMLGTGGKAAYKYLSAAAHGTVLALWESLTPEMQDRGHEYVVKTAKWSGVSFLAAVEQKARLYGWAVSRG